jgi:hypothetical protein
MNIDLKVLIENILNEDDMNSPLKPSGYSQSSDFVKYNSNPTIEDESIDPAYDALSRRKKYLEKNPDRKHVALNKDLESGSVIRVLYYELLDDNGNLNQNLDEVKEIAINFLRLKRYDFHIMPELLFRTTQEIKDCIDIKRFYKFMCHLILKYEQRPVYFKFDADPLKWFKKIVEQGDTIAKESGVDKQVVTQTSEEPLIPADNGQKQDPVRTV